ncbi:thiamine diphosphokinase [Heyndrickxia sp. NPDC080065]|uniref:thiamine diphosphokinase n=1 Tax=Heyndrickxia sp. NPDC080065 TaxID=3390568 RepID=UPI003CFE6612
MQKVIHIIAGGPQEYIPELSLFDHPNVVWIGVDYGVIYLLENNIIPTMAFGDFDSVTNQQWEMINKKAHQIKKYIPEKDETDMELALLWALKEEPSNIRILGATGGRADHYFANVMMLIRPECKKCNIEIIDKQNRISVFTPGKYSIDMIDHKKYVSFIPLSKEVNGITLEGFKYPLKNKHILMGSSLCISNELIQETGNFSFTSGILMMIRSQDL